MSAIGTSLPWTGAAAPRARRQFTWNALLWALVFPRRGQRIVPTVSGVLLMVLALGIGTAAYNSANNILFITLSLLLACLILSGTLSWLNFHGVTWRLELAPPLRAGQAAAIGLALHNRKTFLPTYGMWFDLGARFTGQTPPAVAESTLTGRGLDVRAVLAQAAAAEVRGQLFLRERLDPLGTARLDWTFRPAHRGRLTVALTGIGSLFPFGFLRKTLSIDVQEELVVWPAAVAYHRHPVAAERRRAGGEQTSVAGSGGDLQALRRYASGDSHRLIHWKASARSRTLLVRQFAAESAESFSLWLCTDAALWPRPEQFELLVSLGATLAEDLFRAGQLGSAGLDEETPVPIRHVRDLEQFLDRLAVVQPRAGAAGGGEPSHPLGATARPASHRNLLTFAPDGARGVAAYLNGEKTATA